MNARNTKAKQDFTDWMMKQPDPSLEFMSIVANTTSWFLFGITGILVYQGRFWEPLASFGIAVLFNTLTVWFELALLTKAIKERFGIKCTCGKCE